MNRKQFLFNDLLEALRIGLEVDFQYNSKKYSITHSNGMWYFCCDTDNISNSLCGFEEKEKLLELVSEIVIENNKLTTIFNNLQYNTSELYY